MTSSDQGRGGVFVGMGCDSNSGQLGASDMTLKDTVGLRGVIQQLLVCTVLSNRLRCRVRGIAEKSTIHDCGCESNAYRDAFVDHQHSRLRLSINSAPESRIGFIFTRANLLV